MSEHGPLDRLLDQVDASELRAERQGHLEAIGGHQKRIDAIDTLLALKGETEIPPSRNGGNRVLTSAEIEVLTKPSLAASILSLMETAPEWNADLLLAHLEQRGRAPQGQTPKNSVAATLSRLTSEGKVKRIRPGFYTLVRNGQDAAPAATGEAEQQQLVEGGR